MWWFVSSALAQSQSQEMRYGVKQNTIQGSILRPNEVAYSKNIPPHLRYEELPDDAKARVRGYYEKMDDADEPPYPAQGLRPIMVYAGEAQTKLRSRGELYVVATVDPDGRVNAVKTIGSPSAEMTEFMGKLVMITPFKPAKCKGVPCQQDFPLRFQFQ
jgi:hypothetical protein